MSESLTVSAPARASVTDLVVTAPPPHHAVFDEFLSELNPLQYLPVIGTIYRALTGDTIPEEARTVGSLVVSGLTGGPAGVAMSVAALAAEKIIGFDPERLGQTVLADLGLGHGPAAAPKVPAAATVRPDAAVVLPATLPGAAAPLATAWSPAQLMAYGVTRAPGGELRCGAIVGSDVLNGLELGRIAAAGRTA